MAEGKKDLSLLKLALSMMGVAVLLCLLVTGVNHLLTMYGYSAWWLLLVVPVVIAMLVLGVVGSLFLLAAVFALLGEEQAEKVQAKLDKEGIRTVSKVISSNKYATHEDVCMRGKYVYQDEQGQAYECAFDVCFHWPSDAQWNEVKKIYSLGATHTVIYLPSDPRSHAYPSDVIGTVIARSKPVTKPT